MERDPRKKYALQHKHLCKELPLHVRMHIPECRKDFKDYAMGGRRPIPPTPPLPTWKAPLDVPYRAGYRDYTTQAIIGGTMEGAGVIRRLGDRGRAKAPRTRIAPAEEERPLMRAEPAVEDRPAPSTSRANRRLSSGLQTAFDEADRVEEVARSVPMTSVSALDIENLPRAFPPNRIRADPRLSDEFGGDEPNPSVRPQPKQQQLTKRRKLRFREEYSPAEHPADASVSDPLPAEIQRELDTGIRTTAKGKGKARSTRASRAERTSSIFDNMSGRQQDRSRQTEREQSRGRSLTSTSDLEPTRASERAPDVRMPPPSSTDDMLDSIDRLQTRQPTEISSDQGMLEGGDMEDVPLLSGGDAVPKDPPRITNMSKIKNVIRGLSPMDKIAALQARVQGYTAPTEQSTTRTIRSQASRSLATDRGSLADAQQSIDTTQDAIKADNARITTAQASVTSDTANLTSVDTADDTEIADIDSAIDQVGMGGLSATTAEDLDGGIGVSQSVAERLGLFGEKLAATTAGRVAGGALKVIGTPIRMVQAVGDATGDVLKQGAIKVGQRVGGEVGARIALTAARGVGLVASAAGITTGGGILDPVTDAIGAGLLLAIPLEMAGTAIRHSIEGQEQYNGISGATKAGMGTDLFTNFMIKGDQAVKKLMKGVPMDQVNQGKTKATWWKPATIKAHSEDAYQENEYLSNVVMAGMEHHHSPSTANEPIYYNDKTTNKSGFVVPLTDQQLKNAMAVYQKNPDAFSSYDPIQLQIMGLNPAMSQGKSGATKVGNIYIPTSYQSGKKLSQTTPLSQIYAGADGKYPDPTTDNYSNAFLSWNRRSTSTASENYFTSSSPPTLDPATYVSDTQTIINGMTDAKAKAYMSNQLAWFKYYNTGGAKPTTKIAAPSDATSQSALTDATNDLSTAQSQLTTDEATLSQNQLSATQLQSNIKTLSGEAQTTTTTSSSAAQLQAYQNAANTYNQNVANQVYTTEQQLQTGSGLTAQEYEGLNKVLQQQVVAQGVTTYTQNQLANLPRAGTSQLTSSQGATSPTLSSGQSSTTSSTGVTTRASPSASTHLLTPAQQTQVQTQNLSTEPNAAKTQQSQNVGSYFG